jgi:hypothetical protein
MVQVSIDSRLNRLTTGLSPKERGILMLRAYKGEITADPLWRTTVQPQDYDAVDSYVRLINACNINLAAFVTQIQGKTDQAWTLYWWLDSVLALGLQSWHLALLTPTRDRPRAEKALARFDSLAVSLPWNEQQGVFTWLELVDDLRGRLGVAFTVAWTMLRAAEMVADEAAERFDGEDPLRPVARETLAKCRRRLLDLQGLVKVMAGCEPQEPDEEWIELARFFTDRGKGILR